MILILLQLASQENQQPLLQDCRSVNIMNK
uniref:Uncharacterized protein n=1 Tax=Rhizophora mucronata TaxID=61149 RepID=A0A2P2QKT3_RHIMU